MATVICSTLGIGLSMLIPIAHPDSWNSCSQSERSIADAQEFLESTPAPAQPKRKPLTDEGILQIALDIPVHNYPGWLIDFARAIETAHEVRD